MTEFTARAIKKKKKSSQNLLQISQPKSFLAAVLSNVCNIYRFCIGLINK